MLKDHCIQHSSQCLPATGLLASQLFPLSLLFEAEPYGKRKFLAISAALKTCYCGWPRETSTPQVLTSKELSRWQNPQSVFLTWRDFKGKHSSSEIMLSFAFHRVTTSIAVFYPKNMTLITQYRPLCPHSTTKGTSHFLTFPAFLATPQHAQLTKIPLAKFDLLLKPVEKP